MNRATYLLREAAQALTDGTDPFNTDWLDAHQVTFDECLTLGTLLSIGADLIAWLMEHPDQASAALDGARLAAITDAIARIPTAASHG